MTMLAISVRCRPWSERFERVSSERVTFSASPSRSIATSPTSRYSSYRRSTISGIKRVSRPGLRVYSKAEGVPRVLGGMGIAIVSTNQGLLTDREARERRVGGEILCQVW